MGLVSSGEQIRKGNGNVGVGDGVGICVLVESVAPGTWTGASGVWVDAGLEGLVRKLVGEEVGRFNTSICSVAAGVPENAAVRIKSGSPSGDPGPNVVPETGPVQAVNTNERIR
jgi:hypothetical protein